MITERLGDWMQTAHGRAYWPRDPRPEEVFLDDIALSLSNQCRYGGQMPRRKWHAVAYHSVLVSEVVQLAVMKDPSLSPYSWRVTAACGLFHDAAEAYLVDVPRPAKKALDPVYSDLERINMTAIAKRFDLPLLDMPQIVWEADERVLFTERRDLLAPPPRPWVNEGKIELLPRVIKPLPPTIAEVLFLRRVKELGIKEIAA
jgi:hypothetical protein